MHIVGDNPWIGVLFSYFAWHVEILIFLSHIYFDKFIQQNATFLVFLWSHATLVWREIVNQRIYCWWSISIGPVIADYGRRQLCCKFFGPSINHCSGLHSSLVTVEEFHTEAKFSGHFHSMFCIKFQGWKLFSYLDIALEEQLWLVTIFSLFILKKIFIQ